MNQNMAIYKAKVSAPFGLFLIAVNSIEMDARGDIMTAALSEFNCPAGMLRVKAVSKSNRRILRRMVASKHCQTSDKGCWAWIKRIK